MFQFPCPFTLVQRYLLSMKNVKERLGTPNENQLFRYGCSRTDSGNFVIVNYVSTLERKGREIRTQTQLIIDDVLLIDFPDSYLHLLQYDLCFADFDFY